MIAVEHERKSDLGSNTLHGYGHQLMKAFIHRGNTTKVAHQYFDVVDLRHLTSVAPTFARSRSGVDSCL